LREERAQDDLKTGVSRPPMLRAEVGPEAAVVPSQGASDFPIEPRRNCHNQSKIVAAARQVKPARFFSPLPL
ncbi:MAG: hypothetical protein V3T69_04410, partial [Acidiferrobacterales bacterium]